METNKQTLLIVIAIALVVVLFFMLTGSDEQVAPEEETTETSTEATTGGTTNTSGNTNTGGSSGSTNTIPPAEQLRVVYTSAGFSPFLLEVDAGDTVTFVNNTGGTMWITSKGHPTAVDQNYPEFDSGKSIPPGGSYEFMFTKLGSWGYKNLNNEDHLGAIVVNPQ